MPPAHVGCGRDAVRNEEEVLDAVCGSEFRVQRLQSGDNNL